MTTARQKVLTYLTKNRTSSAREISRSLKMSAATVRHHLRVMASDGRLEMVSVRNLDGRGRPEKVYSLPRAMMGDNLSMLGDALLTEAGSKLKMEAVARRLAGESDFTSQPITKRLNSIVEKLNQMNYHARWEAGAEGPRVYFGHCPYVTIIAKHPELCNLDSELVGSLMGQSAKREERTETQRSICPFVFLFH